MLGSIKLDSYFLESILQSVMIAAVLLSVISYLFKYLSPKKNISINAKDKVIDLETYENLTLKEKEELFKNTKERDKFLKLIEEKINNEANEDFISKLKINVEKKLENIENDNNISKYYSKIITRLNEELIELRKRSDLSLIIGITTTLIGLGFLGYFSINFETTAKSLFEFFIEFLPRLSLVIFIQIFAYFFLKLYKFNLSEIKFIQNELTSIESKLLAIRIAIEHEDKEVIKYVVESLMKTERNFILEKGQTTIDIEKMKSDQSSSNETLGKIADIFKGK